MRTMIVALQVLFAMAAHAREAPLPVPPIPPAQTPWSAAPVPNVSGFSAPQDTRNYSLGLFPEINHRADPGAGFGYAPGAHYQLDNDRRLALPGIMLRVPLR